MFNTIGLTYAAIIVFSGELNGCWPISPNAALDGSKLAIKEKMGHVGASISNFGTQLRECQLLIYIPVVKSLCQIREAISARPNVGLKLRGRWM